MADRDLEQQGQTSGDLSTDNGPLSQRNQKRKDRNSLEVDSRNVKTKPNDTTNMTTPESAVPVFQQPGTPQVSQVPEIQITEDLTEGVQNIQIQDLNYPTFKLLRRLHNRKVTADHHHTFLTNLRTKNQVPTGLQANEHT